MSINVMTLSGVLIDISGFVEQMFIIMFWNKQKEQISFTLLVKQGREDQRLSGSIPKYDLPPQTFLFLQPHSLPFPYMEETLIQCNYLAFIWKIRGSSRSATRPGLNLAYFYRKRPHSPNLIEHTLLRLHPLTTEYIIICGKVRQLLTDVCGLFRFPMPLKLAATVYFRCWTCCYTQTIRSDSFPISIFSFSYFLCLRSII